MKILYELSRLWEMLGIALVAAAVYGMYFTIQAAFYIDKFSFFYEK